MVLVEYSSGTMPSIYFKDYISFYYTQILLPTHTGRKSLYISKNRIEFLDI